jgi:hypothetical protein
MPTYDGIGSSITHRVEVVGDSLFQDVDGGTLSTKVPVQIFSNYYASPGSVDSSRQLRFRVQPDGESNVSNSYVTDMGVKGADGSNYFFITAPQNTSNVGDQNTFVISTTSNVGIGTTDPEKPLHVVGDSWITGTLTASNIVGASPVTISSDLVMASGFTLTAGAIEPPTGSESNLKITGTITTSNIVANTGDNLLVSSSLEVGTSNLFVDTSTGRVGIGTDSPIDNFVVFKNTLLSSNVEDSTYAVFGNQYSSGDVLNVVSFGDVRICCDANNASTGKKISFITNGGTNYDSGTVGGGSELMTILDTGNVGIGVASPIRRLDVRSGTSSTTNTTDWISGTFGPQLNDGDRVVIGNLFTKATIGAHNSSLGAWADLTINSAGGNVGIGTSATPACRLDVRGGGTLSPVVEFGDNGSIISFMPSTKAGSSGTYTGWTSIDPNRRSSTGSTGIAVWDAFHVQGTFSATTKNFIIDHPTNPKTKKLVHASVESPRFDLMYRGSATLQNGTCVININKDSVGSPDCEMEDGTFEALCRDPVYYLQNTSGFDRVIGKIEGSNLTITSENQTSTDVINWMVIAERKDREIKVASSTYDDGRLITEIFDDSIRVDKQGNTIYDE